MARGLMYPFVRTMSVYYWTCQPKTFVEKSLFFSLNFFDAFVKEIISQ